MAAREAEAVNARPLMHWRVMALLVEALERYQFVTITMVRPEGATFADIAPVMREAGMILCGRSSWEAGHGTYAWLIYWMHGVVIGEVACA